MSYTVFHLYARYNYFRISIVRAHVKCTLSVAYIKYPVYIHRGSDSLRHMFLSYFRWPTLLIIEVYLLSEMLRSVPALSTYTHFLHCIIDPTFPMGRKSMGHMNHQCSPLSRANIRSYCILVKRGVVSVNHSS